MKWPWHRKPKATAGTAARKAATAHLDEANSRWPEVIRVAASLRQLREANGFASQIEQIFHGGHS